MVIKDKMREQFGKVSSTAKYKRLLTMHITFSRTGRTIEMGGKNQDIDVTYKAASKCQNTAMIHCLSLGDFTF